MRIIPHDGILERHERQSVLLLKYFRDFVREAGQHGFLTSAGNTLTQMEWVLREAVEDKQNELSNAQRYVDQNGLNDYLVD